MCARRGGAVLSVAITQQGSPLPHCSSVIIDSSGEQRLTPPAVQTCAAAAHTSAQMSIRPRTEPPRNVDIRYISAPIPGADILVSNKQARVETQVCLRQVAAAEFLRCSTAWSRPWLCSRDLIPCLPALLSDGPHCVSLPMLLLLLLLATHPPLSTVGGITMKDASCFIYAVCDLTGRK